MFFFFSIYLFFTNRTRHSLNAFFFRKGDNATLKIYIDANYVGFVVDKKSTFGYYMFLEKSSDLEKQKIG